MGLKGYKSVLSRIMTVLPLLVAIQSCSLFGSIDSPSEGENIKFTIECWSETKGTLTEESTMENFGLYGFLFAYPWDTHNVPDFISNEEVTKASGWATNYRYPKDGRYLRFYAYSPYNCTGATLPGTETSGAILIRYTVPSDISQQSDLMVSVSEDILGQDDPDYIPLTFHHTLTAIRFVTDTQIKTGTIKSIAIRGVYNSGILIYGESPLDKPSWSISGSKGDFVISNLNRAVSAGVADMEITDQNQIFMMIPQNPLPSGARLEIVFNDGITDHILTKPLSGLSWPQGEIITYKISTTSI